MAAVVLIHSPLVGPLTWQPVADELRRRGHAAIVPALREGERDVAPFWQQHADAVARALRAVAPDRALVLAGHSGAGPLLPAIRAALDHPVSAYVFVDAGLPEDGRSRLDLLREELPEMAGRLEQLLAAGGRFPNWTDEVLQPVLPDPRQRAAVLAEIHPQPRAFWAEPLPVIPDWPDAPCAYLQFSPVYDVPAARARALGWPYTLLTSGHFHMLVDPPAVTDALLDLVDRLGIAGETNRRYPPMDADGRR
jgi:hypothetical protein